MDQLQREPVITPGGGSRQDKLLNPYAQNPSTVKLYETTLFRLSVTDINTGCVSVNEDLVTVVVNGGPPVCFGRSD